MEGKSHYINTCIACNQACLDHVFENKMASCLVNPLACNETEFEFTMASWKKKLAVVGAGPAGLSFAVYAAERGHEVDLYEASSQIGGQFNMAKKIPGKEEFVETLRYFKNMIELNGVNLHLNKKVSADELLTGQYEEIILATGVSPREVDIPGIDHPKVLSYIDVLQEEKTVGKKVAIVGAGGIGFDVAEYLTHEAGENFENAWGIDKNYSKPGGLKEIEPQASKREVFILQRSKGKPGAKLGKTTGWIHRLSLKNKKVKMLSNVSYKKIDDQGLHITQYGENSVLEVDHVIICAGQTPKRDLEQKITEAGNKVHLIGGADVAKQLDAKRAIDQGMRCLLYTSPSPRDATLSRMPSSA